MRAIFLILIVAVVLLIGAVATGIIDIRQTQPASLPTVGAENGAVTAQAGRPPEFEIQTGTVAVGTREANVAVPKVEVTRDQATVKVPSVEVRKPVDNGAAPAAQ